MGGGGGRGAAYFHHQLAVIPTDRLEPVLKCTDENLKIAPKNTEARPIHLYHPSCFYILLYL